MKKTGKPLFSLRKIPAQARSKELVETMLLAAARVFRATDGLRVDTNRIAEIAGVSIGSLYQYFPNKNSLIAALIEREAKRMHGVIEGKLEEIGSQPLLTKIEAIFKVIEETFLKERTYLQRLFLLAPSLQRVDVMIRARKHSVLLVKSILEREEWPAKKDADLDALSFALVNFVMGSVDFLILSEGSGELPANPASEDVFKEISRMLRSYFTA